MGALCYMLIVALILFITQRFNIPSFQYLASNSIVHVSFMLRWKARQPPIVST